ncbi:MAG: HU family DNA-binding protein [Pseudomonadota bacterium]|nr:HU family DNA-binding protein [Pseudomonadota bacterium]
MAKTTTTKAKTAPAETAAPKAARVPASKAPPAPPPRPAVPNTITLKHLAASLTDRHDMPTKQATEVVGAMFGMIVEHLKAGDRIRIGGLGIIEVKDRAARMGRNPATGEVIQIKASKKIAFRAAKELKDAI